MSTRSTQPAAEVPPVQFVLPPPDRVLRQHEVVARVGLSIETIYRRMKASEFPKPVRLGPGSVGWRESAINVWIANLPEIDFPIEEGPEPDWKERPKRR